MSAPAQCDVEECDNTEDLRFCWLTVTLPTGDTATLGNALMMLPLKWMVGYRMQFFLYLKSAGNTEIWTPNCWMGVDFERPVPA